MIYTVKITFLDGKTIDINVEKDKTDEFFSDLKEKKIYWTSEATQGFWLDMEKVRYVQFAENKNVGVADDGKSYKSKMDGLGDDKEKQPKEDVKEDAKEEETV